MKIVVPSIRHCFLIQHENWGTIEVGTFCCDKLTDTNLASNCLESQTSYKTRKIRFINSKRWKAENDKYTIKQSSFDIELTNKENYYLIKIYNLQGKTKYESLEIAKSKAFDVIESGEFIEYLSRHKIPFSETKKRKTKNEN